MMRSPRTAAVASQSRHHEDTIAFGVNEIVFIEREHRPILPPLSKDADRAVTVLGPLGPLGPLGRQGASAGASARPPLPVRRKGHRLGPPSDVPIQVVVLALVVPWRFIGPRRCRCYDPVAHLLRLVAYLRSRAGQQPCEDERLDGQRGIARFACPLDRGPECTVVAQLHRIRREEVGRREEHGERRVVPLTECEESGQIMGEGKLDAVRD